MSAAILTGWITQLLERAEGNGFTTKETATLVRSLSNAKPTGRGCYEYGTTYGDFFGSDGRRTTLHRALFEALNGRLDGSLVVRHKCDNPPCIRPTHLESGTESQNVRDAYDRQRMAHIRHARGEDSGRAVLTEDDVRRIRRLRKAGASYLEIQAAFPGVGYNTIHSAAVGVSWPHITDEPPCPKAPRLGTTRMRVAREEVEPIARRAFEAGDSLRAIGKRLGIGSGTLTTWKREWELANL